MSAAHVAIVIPARYGSTRFPGKPLARATGKFLIQHVVEQAQQARRAGRVVVATDDTRILEAVRGFGGEAVMTSAAHHSGTDRIAEVIRMPAFSGVELVVNLQGDEPDLDPGLIDELIMALEENPAGPRKASPGEIAMATASAPFAHPQEIENPNCVKVVVDHRECALYFSRAVIPYDRDRTSNGAPLQIGANTYRKHLGIYAYRREALLRLSAAPVCEIERLEKLEQLRALYLGMKILVRHTQQAPHGVDTPEDYAAFVNRFRAEQHAHSPTARESQSLSSM